MKTIKNLIAATAALAICFTPTASPIAKPKNVSYAVINTAGTSATLNMPDSSIYVSCSKRKYGGGGALNIKTELNPNKASALYGTWNWDSKRKAYVYTPPKKGNVHYKPNFTTGWIKTDKLRKYNLYYTVKVPKKYSDTDIAKLITITETNRTNDHSKDGNPFIIERNNANKNTFTITKYKEDSTYTTYNVKFPVSVYGDEVKIDIKLEDIDGAPSFTKKSNQDTMNSNVDDIEFSSFSMSDGDIGYTRCDASYANGESVHMLINLESASSSNGGLSTDQLHTYMRTICRLMNSLSDITGIKHKDIYIMFDDDQSGCPQADHFVISNDGNAVVVRMPVAYFVNGTYAFLSTIKNNMLDWGFMHELSHCYSFTGVEKKFAQAYNHTIDDAHTNARGATAMQNCDQLKNIKIVLDSQYYLGNYKEALTKARSHKNSEAEVYDIIKVFGWYANNINDGWIKLEKYFGGEYDNPYVNNGALCAAQEAMNATDYKYYSTYNNKPIKFDSSETYRFINSMFYLSKQAASNGYGASKDSFRKFLKNVVTDNVFAKFIVNKTNNGYLGEATVSTLKGDLNLDKKITSVDVDLGQKFLADNYNNPKNGLTPEGAFNFDTDSNGYINQEDLNNIKKKAK